MFTRSLKDYAVILLDMNNTFMFGGDRFSTSENYYATYREFGGHTLDRFQLDHAINACYCGMARAYENPSRIDNFLSVREGLQTYANIAEPDLHDLELVFAHHECGTVAAPFAEWLIQASQTHRLGLVSNIWAKKPLWLKEFDRAGIGEIWATKVFSSDSRSIKPSKRLFNEALSHFDVPLSKIVFVGDNMQADVIPANAIGLDTVHICDIGQIVSSPATISVASLLYLMPAR